MGGGEVYVVSSVLTLVRLGLDEGVDGRLAEDTEDDLRRASPCSAMATSSGEFDNFFFATYFWNALSIRCCRCLSERSVQYKQDAVTV